jgi:hypothetical protein
MARTAAIKYRLQCLSVPSLSTLRRFGESNVGLAISVSIASAEPIFPNALTNEGRVVPVLDTTNMCNCAGYAARNKRCQKRSLTPLMFSWLMWYNTNLAICELRGKRQSSS